MPICERDPWRVQYFESAPCPDHVRVPTDDLDCWDWNPQFQFVYDKLWVARSQGVVCGTRRDVPSRFPVFAKPRVNLKGMGLGSGLIADPAQFRAVMTDDMMWMEQFAGPHVSSDFAVVEGVIQWSRHATGTPWTDGMFTHWVVHVEAMPEIEDLVARWAAEHLGDYTGMLNVETIGGRMIEVHLRFADQWCDLYGAGWVEALVGLYQHGRWDLNEVRRVGYSVPLFARHGLVPKHPSAVAQARIRALPHVSSLQITFHEAKAGDAHPMPPGGFRLGIVNCLDLAAGVAAREALVSCFSGVEVMLPAPPQAPPPLSG